MSAPDWTLPNDPLGAFCRHNHATLAGSGDGPLAGLTFAVKDAFDIARAPDRLRPSGLARHPRCGAGLPALAYRYVDEEACPGCPPVSRGVEMEP